MPKAEQPFAGRRRLPVPSDWPPTLLVVVDTEEEFDHQAPFGLHDATTNVALQPLAQALLDAHGIVPTYVVDYPVASARAATDVLGPIFQAGRCDLGAHLHPWVNPPQEGPVDEAASYPGNLPVALELQKLTALTERIAEAFGRRPVIYKAGRYGVGPGTAGTLDALGYRVDVSAVPHTDFSAAHGPDFSRLPDEPFRLSETLIGLPLSVGFVGRLSGLGSRWYPTIAGDAGLRLRLPAIASRLGLLERLRLTPEGHTLSDMQRHVCAAMAQGQRLFMLTYHSSSLLPGATPYVRTPAERAEFLARLDEFCKFFLRELGGRPMTVAAVAAALDA